MCVGVYTCARVCEVTRPQCPMHTGMHGSPVPCTAQVSMSVHLCLSMWFLHSVGVSACHAQGLGWARQGDNGDQGRHNSSSQSQFLQG